MAAVIPGIGTAHAADEVVVVREGDVARQVEDSLPEDNWVIYTRAASTTPPRTGAGTVTFEEGPPAPPLGEGSLGFVTPDGSAKVYAFNFDHIGTKLADIDGMSYSTYRSAGDLQQVSALNMVIDFDGGDATTGFATLVFEPVYNTAQGPVVSGEWQDWDAAGEGIWWSTRAIGGGCAGATASCDQTWDSIKANNPDAVILGGFGINQGSGNPNLDVNVDALSISVAGDATTYDFEPEPPLTVSVADTSVGEGNSGTRPATFTLELSAPAPGPVTVDYATADGTADSGQDYSPVSGTASFATGETTATVEVPVIGDKLVEADEDLTLTLSNPTGAELGDDEGTGTIVDDDVARLRVLDASVVEGDSGAKPVKLKVTLSKTAPYPITVTYTTADGTAVAGEDYFAETGTVTFAPGQKTRRIVVASKGDRVDEGVENFTVTLSDPTGAGINDGEATVFINDND